MKITYNSSNNYEWHGVGHIHLKKASNISSFKDNQKAYLAFNMMVCASTKEYLILKTTSKEIYFCTTILLF
jgi:hypothetical protein